MKSSIDLDRNVCVMPSEMEPQRQKTTCASNEDLDYPAHSRSLIRFFTVRILDS